MTARYAIGYDVGSSSVKAALVCIDDGHTVAVVRHPQSEMPIDAPTPGWAEQDPEMWWQALCAATHKLVQTSGIDPAKISGIGLAYQMHGLVLLDTEYRVLRPAIIWCDSRAVGIGDATMDALGPDYCLKHLLNGPGNFTASRLKWVRDHEPGVYERVAHAMLPGDYLAHRLTGEISTTVTGLSEGVMWDFPGHELARALFDHLQIDRQLIPEVVPVFGIQGHLSGEAARATGLPTGIPLKYRAGDQPNNAYALGALQPGSVAATGGTSGVVYGVADRLVADPYSRINSFAHVNHTQERPRIGLLLCINGAGIQYAWLRQIAGAGYKYSEMETMAGGVPVGSAGVRVLPFGNGAERMLQNAMPGAQIRHLHFNEHGPEHLFRAGLEGVACAFAYGFEMLRELGFQPESIRVGNDNLFRSRIFGETVATLLQLPIEVHDTTGAVGAAIGSFVGQPEDIDAFLAVERVITPASEHEAYHALYASWCDDLQSMIS